MFKTVSEWSALVIMSLYMYYIISIVTVFNHASTGCNKRGNPAQLYLFLKMIYHTAKTVNAQGVASLAATVASASMLNI